MVEQPQPSQEPATAPAADATTTVAATSEAAPAPTRLGAPVPASPPWDPRPGQAVRVHLRIIETTKKGQEKERLQVFEGIVIARRHGNEPGATFTVRKEAKGGFGVERIFPLFAPTVAKVEVVGGHRIRRAKLHYLRAPLKKGKKLVEAA